MRLSFQTVCIIFGVTLVHLIVIAALSPVGSEGENMLGPVPELVIEGEVGGSPAPAPGDSLPAAVEMPAEASRPDAAPAEPIDLPARRREEASTPVNPAPEPVAATRPVPVSPRS